MEHKLVELQHLIGKLEKPALEIAIQQTSDTNAEKDRYKRIISCPSPDMITPYDLEEVQYFATSKGLSYILPIMLYFVHFEIVKTDDNLPDTLDFLIARLLKNIKKLDEVRNLYSPHQRSVVAWAVNALTQFYSKHERELPENDEYNLFSYFMKNGSLSDLKETH